MKIAESCDVCPEDTFEKCVDCDTKRIFTDYASKNIADALNKEYKKPKYKPSSVPDYNRAKIMKK